MPGDSQLEIASAKISKGIENSRGCMRNFFISTFLVRGGFSEILSFTKKYSGYFHYESGEKTFRLASTRQLFHPGQMRIKPKDSVDGFTPKPIEERNVSIAMYVGIAKVDQYSAYYQQS